MDIKISDPIGRSLQPKILTIQAQQRQMRGIRLALARLWLSMLGQMLLKITVLLTSRQNP